MGAGLSGMPKLDKAVGVMLSKTSPGVFAKIARAGCRWVGRYIYV